MVESTFVTTSVVALVEFIKRLRVKDYFACALIVSAGVIGGIAGYFGIESLTIPTGIIAGLSASGLITVVKSMRS